MNALARTLARLHVASEMEGEERDAALAALDDAPDVEKHSGESERPHSGAPKAKEAGYVDTSWQKPDEYEFPRFAFERQHGRDSDAGANKPKKHAESVYGKCPICGAPGVNRERRPNGNDRCKNGHTYPSKDATQVAGDNDGKPKKHAERGLPDVLRFGEWEESKHPRADDGKFGSGTGGGKVDTTPPGKPEGDDVRKPFATDDEMMARAKECAPRQIVPVNVVGHTPLSAGHLREIAESMREDGWNGPPLLAMKRGDVWQGLTGSHRLAAAEQADISVPVVFVSQSDVLDWAAKAGYELPDDADLTDLEDEDRLAIIMAGGNAVAKEIMNREVEKWEGGTSKHAEKRAATQLPPRGPVRHAEGGDGGDYAAWACGLLNQILRAGGKDEAGRAGEALAESLDAAGWAVAFDPRRGRYIAAPSERDPAFDEFAERAPKGGTSINGKQYRGGMFIPSSAIKEAEQKAASGDEKAKAELSHLKSGKAAESARLEKRGPVDREKLAAKLKHDGTDASPLQGYHAKQAAASARALFAHHGDLALHRIDEIADAVRGAMDKTEDPEEKARLGQRLAGLAVALEHAGTVKGVTGERGAKLAPVEEKPVGTPEVKKEIAAGKPWGMRFKDFLTTPRDWDFVRSMDGHTADIPQDEREATSRREKAESAAHAAGLTSYDLDGTNPAVKSKAKQALIDAVKDARNEEMRLYTANREAKQRSLHRKVVEAALAAGKPVPPEVLKDYPDLAPKASPAAQAPAQTGLPELTPRVAPAAPAQPLPPIVTPPKGPPKASEPHEMSRAEFNASPHAKLFDPAVRTSHTHSTRQYGGKKPWLARVTGTSAKYGLAQEFINGTSSKGGMRRDRIDHEWDVDEPGLYRTGAHGFHGDEGEHFVMLPDGRGGMTRHAVDGADAVKIAKGLERGLPLHEAASKAGFTWPRLARLAAAAKGQSDPIAHVMAVENALKAGKAVPPRVIAEYPDLAAKYPPKA